MIDLASSSHIKKQLLNRIDLYPNYIINPYVSIEQLRGEKPQECAIRLARYKNQNAHKDFPNDIIISSQTIASVGRLVLPSAHDISIAEYCITKLSGKRHRVITALNVTYKDLDIVKIGITVIKFKRFTPLEQQKLIKLNNGYSGYDINGYASCLIQYISGMDITNIMGLPLYYAKNCLLRFIS
jgi:septum formation protein